MRELLCEKLREINFPPDPVQIIGRPFIFGDEEHVVAGTIHSIGYGPNEGIKLYVSTPRFRGIDIRYLFVENKRWTVIGASNGCYGLKASGELELL